MPYCPSCGLRVAHSARCGLDGSLLRQGRCPSCGGEVGPGDHFCGHCRHNLQLQPARWLPLDLRPAPWWRRLGAFLFDGLGSLMVVHCFWEGPAPLILACLPIWVSLLEAHQIATPGQQIFSLRRLQSNGEGLTRRHWGPSLVAALWPWHQGSTKVYWVPQ